MTTPETIRVLIVDDDPLVRAGLRLMLNGAHGIQIVAEASDGTAVASTVDEYRPDVLLMDIRMPTMDGPTATELLRSQPDPPHILILTTFNADQHVLRALRAAAAGFILKDTPPGDIVAAIQRIARGEPVLSPAVIQRLIAHVADTDHDRRRTQAQDRLAQLPTANARSPSLPQKANPTPRSARSSTSASSPSRPTSPES